jgi:hypothetical protein
LVVALRNGSAQWAGATGASRSDRAALRRAELFRAIAEPPVIDSSRGWVLVSQVRPRLDPALDPCGGGVYQPLHRGGPAGQLRAVPGAPRPAVEMTRRDGWNDRGQEADSAGGVTPARSARWPATDRSNVATAVPSARPALRGGPGWCPPFGGIRPRPSITRSARRRRCPGSWPGRP